MSTGWTKTLATVAVAAASALAIGCGPAPGYEQQAPRVPVGYTPVDETNEPASSAELAARGQAAQAGQAAQQGTDVQAAPGDIAVGADDTQYTDTDPSALTEFKPALDGHGQWVDDSTYGTVWVPAESEVGTDFVPYTTAGHWTYAEDTDYVWVSDYSWGWAPFHYGRWAHVGRHGWVWIPGRTYAGAWVVWRTGPGYDYVGWAPAGPDWYWYNGYAVGWTFGYSPYYSYCNHRYFYDRGVNTYVVRGPAGREHEGHTRPYVPAAGSTRVAAIPTVGSGGGRTAATPSVVGAAGARTSASPRVGPRPSELGIAKDAVVAPPGDHAGLARASAFSSPSTAVAQGAAPPASVVRRRLDHDAIATAPAPRGFEGHNSIGGNRFDAAARAPQVQGVTPVPQRAPSSSSMTDGRSPSSHAFGGSPSAAVPSQPTFRSQPSQPAFAQPSQPAFAQPSQQQAVRSQPSVASPPVYRSAPSVSSPPPSFRSTPSVAQQQPHYSAPVHQAPSVSHAATPSAPRPSTRSSAPATRSKR